MSISDGLLQEDCLSAASDGSTGPLNHAHGLLSRGFGVDFNLLDGGSGDLLYASADQPACDFQRQAELCRQVAARKQPEFIADEPPLVMLAVPLSSTEDDGPVAVATFVTHQVSQDDDLAEAASSLGMDPDEAVRWAHGQTSWAPEALQRVAWLVMDRLAETERISRLEDEAESLRENMSSTYEEISLLYRLTQHLKISESEEELGRVALEWLEEVLPAEGLAIQLVPIDTEDETLNPQERTEPVLLTAGRCPVTNQQFSQLADVLDLRSMNQPVVVNHARTREPDWPCRQVRQMTAVPLAEGENLFGWLAAFNHVDDNEFGTVEASLVSSVGTILGIHSGNIELYRQQSELLAGIVRALTSAIDAKDPYTCGHSERVARVSVRLAQELGCDPETVNTIYLSGLLHDIGKIGVSDSVLRKPGQLTDEEYQHIKTHVEVGHKILVGLRKLDDVLPVVLHHHESWDGRGYPGRLPEQEIPLSARIVAVADAFDAMGSDRPYRKGLPDEKIDAIFREGAGKQWDPAVTVAFFRARDDIRQIVNSQQEQADACAQALNVPQ